jgi:hypothetical protein
VISVYTGYMIDDRRCIISSKVQNRVRSRDSGVEANKLITSEYGTNQALQFFTQSIDQKIELSSV